MKLKKFYVGDLVKVISKAEDLKNGWLYPWAPCMDYYIGKIYQIIEDKNKREFDGWDYKTNSGYGFLLKDNNNMRKCFFPPHCLKLIKRGKKIKQSKWKTAWRNT